MGVEKGNMVPALIRSFSLLLQNLVIFKGAKPMQALRMFSNIACCFDSEFTSGVHGGKGTWISREEGKKKFTCKSSTQFFLYNHMHGAKEKSWVMITIHQHHSWVLVNICLTKSTLNCNLKVHLIFFFTLWTYFLEDRQ